MQIQPSLSLVDGLPQGEKKSGLGNSILKNRGKQFISHDIPDLYFNL